MKKIFVILILLAFCLPAFSDLLAVDPTSRATNARTIGLGRAFTGLADDPSAIFFNPAGLASDKTLQLSSMSGRFIEDYNYMSVSAALPTKLGVFGIGYGAYRVGGVLPTTTLEGSDPNDPIYVIDPTKTSISDQNNTYILTYATKLDRFLPRNVIARRLSVGANLKWFSAGLAGGGIANGNATGSEMDLGILYDLNPAVKLGASLLDVLPASMGGKLTYSNGYTEVYPARLKLGVGLNLLGPKNSLRVLGNHELLGAIDADMSPMVSGRPVLYHAGLEWKPVKYVALRVGADQSLFDNLNQSTSAMTDLTYGIGLYYSNFRFDYAYHQFANFPIDSSYFSFSYVPQIIEKPIERIILLEPQDKLITFDQEVMVKGRVNDPEVQLTEINGNKVKFLSNNTFDYNVPLNIGKNKIEINSFTDTNKNRKSVEYKKIRILRLKTFPDVPDGHWGRKQIALVSMINIISGYPDGTFKPEGNITRAEMATMLMKAGSPVNPVQKEMMVFKDLNTSHWAFKNLMSASLTGVVEGYPDGTFRPEGNITRAEGLTMITRFSGVNKAPYEYQYFADVQPTFWTAEIIAGAQKAGLLDFLKGKPFEPAKAMTRAEAVEILYRTQFIQNILNKDLLNWETY